MSEIKNGDTVKLKSGGPVMTVIETDREDSNSVLCIWFTGTERKHHAFPKHTLKKFDTAQDLDQTQEL